MREVKSRLHATNGDNLDNPRHRLVLGLLVAAFVAVSVYNSVHKGLWLDEAYSLNTSQRGLSGVLTQALHFELQPPVYFVLLHWWLLLCSSYVCARLLSTLCAAGVIVCLDALTSLLDMNPRGFLLPVLGVLSPMLLWAASTARGYALTALLVTISLVFYVRIWGEGGAATRRDWILYLASWCIGVFNFYFFAFIIAGQVCGAFLSGKSRRGLLGAVAFMACVLVAASPMITGQLHSHEVNPPPIGVTTASDEPSPTGLTKLMGQITGPVLNYAPVLKDPAGAAILALGCIALVAFRIAGRRPLNFTGPEGLLLPVVVVPLVALWALKTFGFSVLTRRHAIIVLPSMICLLAVWVDGLPQRVVRRAFQSAILGIFLLSAAAFEFDSAPPGDWKAAGQVIRRESLASEPVLVFPADNLLAYRSSTNTTNELHGVPSQPDLTRWTLSEQVVRNTDQVARVISRAAPAGGTAWLLLEEGETAERLGLATVNEYVQTHTEILGKWAFPGAPGLQLLHVRSVVPAGASGKAGEPAPGRDRLP